MATPCFSNTFVPGPLWTGGPTPGNIYNFPGVSTASNNSGVQRTQHPTVTGTSVLGIKFNGGIVLAADMLGSYGSLARYRNCSRLMRVNEQTVIGASGDFADYQFLTSIIKQRVIDEDCLDDGFGYTPPALHSWLTRVLYNRRSQFNPLWNTYIVGGVHGNNMDDMFLGYVDKIGIAYEADTVATGFGAYIALPIMREVYEKNKKMTEKEAVELIERCMRLLFYRDARSLNKYEIAVVTKQGAEIRGPMSAETNWDIAHMVAGYE